MTRTLFAGGMVFDGTGVAPERADVLVVDGRIADIGTDLAADDVVDCQGATLLPGLFDAENERGLYLLVAETFAPVAECALMR